MDDGGTDHQNTDQSHDNYLRARVWNSSGNDYDDVTVGFYIGNHAGNLPGTGFIDAPRTNRLHRQTLHCWSAVRSREWRRFTTLMRKEREIRTGFARLATSAGAGRLRYSATADPHRFRWCQKPGGCHRAGVTFLPEVQ
jgi:hypothetical protein